MFYPIKFILKRFRYPDVYWEYSLRVGFICEHQNRNTTILALTRVLKSKN